LKTVGPVEVGEYFRFAITKHKRKLRAVRAVRTRRAVMP
jgi:hypothetical protein